MRRDNYMDHPPCQMWGSRGKSPRKLQGFTAYSLQNIVLNLLYFNTFFLQIFSQRKKWWGKLHGHPLCQKVEGIYPPSHWISAPGDNDLCFHFFIQTLFLLRHAETDQRKNVWIGCRKKRKQKQH